MTTKKNPDAIRENKILNQAKQEVPGFTELLDCFERTISVLGRIASTFNNYSRHVSAISLYLGEIPAELGAEQVKDYLFYQQKKSKTPS
jgi:integrase/recombinase XerD